LIFIILFIFILIFTFVFIFMCLFIFIGVPKFLSLILSAKNDTALPTEA